MLLLASATLHRQDATTDAVCFGNSLPLELINEGRGFPRSTYSYSKSVTIILTKTCRRNRWSFQGTTFSTKENCEAHSACGCSFSRNLDLSLTVVMALRHVIFKTNNPTLGPMGRTPQIEVSKLNIPIIIVSGT